MSRIHLRLFKVSIQSRIQNESISDYLTILLPIIEERDTPLSLSFPRRMRSFSNPPRIMFKALIFLKVRGLFTVNWRLWNNKRPMKILSLFRLFTSTLKTRDSINSLHLNPLFLQPQWISTQGRINGPGREEMDLSMLTTLWNKSSYLSSLERLRSSEKHLIWFILTQRRNNTCPVRRIMGD
jgi:hypothetical protein